MILRVRRRSSIPLRVLAAAYMCASHSSTRFSTFWHFWKTLLWSPKKKNMDVESLPQKIMFSSKRRFSNGRNCFVYIVKRLQKDLSIITSKKLFWLDHTSRESLTRRTSRLSAFCAFDGRHSLRLLFSSASWHLLPLWRLESPIQSLALWLFSQKNH